MALAGVRGLVLRGGDGGRAREREQWPSRTSFVLASMGGAVGVGNLLRYPSQAAAHAGLQWFVPYVLALLVVGLPLLVLEVALGAAFRGGAAVAFGAVHRRLRGVGAAAAVMAFVTATYYVAIMAYVLVYFRHSFARPLPWAGDNRAFFDARVHRAVPPVTNAAGWKVFPATAVVGETVGWAVLTWVFVYLSIFRGVALTAKVVHVTVLLPLVMCVVLLVRSVTLSGAHAGIRQYVGQWKGGELGRGEIWSAAIRQIFFSIGPGFGYFIAYASYSNVHAHAVQDSLIIALSNCLIEVIMGFAAFAVLGHLRVDLAVEKAPSTFEIGFITYPTAIAEMRGANVWAVFFFIIVYLLAIDSAFALVEAFVTVVTDSDWGARLRKPFAVGVIILGMLLLNIPYCTQFGYYLIDAVDTWMTMITLMFGSWLQCAAVTSVYRYKDVVSQTGIAAFAIAQASYFGSMVLGVVLAHTVSPAAGGGVFAGVLVVGTIVAALVSGQPEVPSPWGGSRFLSSFWWLTSYSGYQLGLDLNTVVAKGRKWNIPFFWSPLLRWGTAPILISILSISYSDFYKQAKNPLHIFAFVLAHIGPAAIVLSFLLPVAFSFLIPESSREMDLRQYETSPGETLVPEEPMVTHDSVEDSTI